MAKVLLVEDDNNLREIYEARLLAEGYTINSAKDGEEALVVAKAEKPDLIISDVMMPKISGFEMLDILRNTQGLKETKVIMLTALGQTDDRTRADSLGADRYLVKSQVTLEDIVKAAHELLEDAATPETPTATDIPVAPTTTEPAPAAAPIPVSEPPAVASPPDLTAVSEPVATNAPVEEPSIEMPAPVSQAAPQAAPAAASETPAETFALDAPQIVTPTPNPVSEPAAPTPLATPPAPSAELPSPAAEVAPQPGSAPEAPAAPAAALTPDVTAAESTVAEQATVNSQIEDFIKNNAVEVSPSQPTPPPNATTDRVMQESVDTLIASTQPAPTDVAAVPPATPVTPSTTSPDPVAEPKNEEEISDGVTIAHKKVIARPGDTATPDLTELLAREEAKQIVTGDTTPGTSNDTPASTPPPIEEPTVPPVAPLPGNTFSPTNGPAPAPKPNDGTDPNSIAL